MKPTDEQVEAAARAIADNDGFTHVWSKHRAEARAALTAAGVKPRVKPLVWSEIEPEWWAAENEMIRLGYEVRITPRGAVRFRFANSPWQVFGGTADAAKASAQADFETRVLSALTTEGE